MRYEFEELRSRTGFREAVFARDNHGCVVCTAPAVDAHHLLERRLWDDGGYYLSNGVALCEPHHLEAEQTKISCDELRARARIDEIHLPAHLDPTERYDKWGNIILPDGFRLPGELFYEASVQKILAPIRNLFLTYVKYPRTLHLPWSPGRTKDDKVLTDLTGLHATVVVTEKLDGECTTLYPDYLHARAITFNPHPSRTWIQALHGRIKHEIPPGWRICGENVYAQHSLRYEHLDDYFFVFSIWNEHNRCLSWEDTVLYASLLGLQTVPVLLQPGQWSEAIMRGLVDALPEIQAHRRGGDPSEGYVVRVTREFAYQAFRRHVAKYVRKDHVQTGDHWMHGPVTPNGLRIKTS